MKVKKVRQSRKKADEQIQVEIITNDLHLVPCRLDPATNKYIPVFKPNSDHIDWSPIAKRTQWKRLEDEIIKKYVAKWGDKAWTQIARKINSKIYTGAPVRKGKQCRERWYNHLNPNTSKGRWNNMEDIFILQSQQKYGNRWSKIAKELGNRTENQVKNRFYSIINKASRYYENSSDIVSMLIAKEREGALTGDQSTEMSLNTISPMNQDESNQDFGFGYLADQIKNKRFEIESQYNIVQPIFPSPNPFMISSPGSFGLTPDPYSPFINRMNGDI